MGSQSIMQFKFVTLASGLSWRKTEWDR